MGNKSTNMKRIILLVLLLIIAALILLRKNSRQQKTDLIKPKVAIIKMKGRVIFAEEFDEAFMQENPQLKIGREDEYYLNALKKEFAYELIDDILLLKLAEQSGITVKYDEVSAEMALLKDGYTKESFDSMLENEGLSEDDIKNLTKKRLLIKKILDEKIYHDITITDEEINNFYEHFKVSFLMPEQYKIAKITVQDESRAKEVSERLMAKEITFEAAMEEYSEFIEPLEPEGKGYVPKSGIPEEFENALTELKTGEISNIINTANGFHILKFIDIKKEHIAPLEEVKERIERMLREQKEKLAYREFMSEYRKEMEVYIYDDYFERTVNEG